MHRRRNHLPSLVIINWENTLLSVNEFLPAVSVVFLFRVLAGRFHPPRRCHWNQDRTRISVWNSWCPCFDPGIAKFHRDLGAVGEDTLIDPSRTHRFRPRGSHRSHY
ncbi:hypothetical protein BHE74_00039335 [Ensete ventricosum]|nr:hypothetical protein GW17_00038452 [Ensete ventricosum]RWW54104.1 hypothetical protein BHE74_00039335 [Ensete ventricosum]